ncbi:MAG: 4Fe-4S binding protein [Endomicrobia bacterium]|nr:4Fe-4S binding protein [Endomicrobiia bacterium]MDW8056581.1 4Fe-4S binding protein [Elusimicrobiota bacterium]
MKFITLLRYFVQSICFLFIVFGSYLGLKKQNLSFLPFIEAPQEYKQISQEGKKIIISGPTYPQAFDTYLPIKSCRFLRQTGTFRACFMHFISESISWKTNLSFMLPHIFLFLVLAVLFGRLWCGWVCPLGFIQDVLNIIRKKLKLNPILLSEKKEKTLKSIKYIMFITIILLSFVAGTSAVSWSLRKQIYLSVCQMCPSRFIFPYLGRWPIVHNFVPLGYGIFTTISLIFLMLVILSFFIKRLWCRICPSGFLLSFFNRGGFLTKQKETIICTRCGICANVCPLNNENLYLEKEKTNIDFSNCIHCFSCIDFCPEDNCLKVKFLGMKIFRSKFK